MNFLNVKTSALRYLGYNGQDLDESIHLLIDECIKEVDELSSFKVTYQKYELSHDPLKIKELDISLDYPELNDLFASCHEVIVIGCTLGIKASQRVQYYSHIDMTKMTIFDAVCSAYLEIQCDEFEKEYFLKKRTFRYCPGYGHVPIELNVILAKIIESYKRIGLSVEDHGVLMPQKSMIGLIGLGNLNNKKSCLNCVNLHDCTYRKRGQTCY